MSTSSTACMICGRTDYPHVCFEHDEAAVIPDVVVTVPADNRLSPDNQRLIETISRALIGAQQLEHVLRQKSDRDFVYQELLPDGRTSLDLIAARLARLETLERALESIAACESYVTGDVVDTARRALLAEREEER